MYEREKIIDAPLILSIIATGMMSFAGVVVETAMNITFPTLMREFQIGTSTVQWITTGYLLVLAIIIPASSYLKRRFTTKALFATAMTLFMIGTVLSAITPVFSLLLLGRLIQGVGTGVALPLMFNIVLEQVPKKQLGLMMGVASLITAMAPAIGPSIGGMIVTLFGWRMIFAVLLPFLAVAFVMGLSSIRQVSPVEKISFNWPDYLCLAVGFSCFIFATSIASAAGWGSAQVLGFLFVAVVAVVIFYRRSAKSQNALIRVQVFHYLPFSFSVLAILCIQFICLGLGFLIPNYAQLVLGQDAFTAGCLLLPGCLVGAMLAPISGKILDRFGAKRPILLGNGCILIATVCFSLFAQNMTMLYFYVFYLCFAFGQGSSVGNTMTNGICQLPRELSTDGNAVINTLQQLAGAVGTSVVATMVAAAQASTPNDLATSTMLGSQNAFILLAVLAVVILCCSCTVFRLTRKSGRRQL